MKILGLNLMAYGPFTNVPLNFEAGNLHIVYGPNEAGKSCTLRALSNVLFGIPQSTPDNFLHPYDDLRIGATIDGGGRLFGVIRRKGREKSLRLDDEKESVFPEAEWRQILPVGTRELFEQMFGIDHARLVEGGNRLATGADDLGNLIFAAAGGLGQLHQIQGELQASAVKLFARQAKNPPLNKALSALKEAAKAMRQLQLGVGDYKKLRDTLEEAELESLRLQSEIADSRAEEIRLQRLLAAIPPANRRRQRLGELQRYEADPVLPQDFEPRFRAADQQTKQAGREKESLADEVEKLELGIRDLPVSIEFIRQTRTIDALYKQSDAVRKGAGDRVRREQALATCRSDGEETLRLLGVRIPFDRAEELRVSEPESVAIFQLSTQHKAVEQELTSAGHDLKKSMESAQTVSAELQALPLAVETSQLEEAVSRIPVGTNLELDLAREVAASERLSSELVRGLAAMPLWKGTREDLENMSAPLPETVEVFRTKFQRQEADKQRQIEKAGEIDGTREDLNRRLESLERDRDVPTEADLSKGRAHRESGWKAVRHAWLDSSPESGNMLGFLGRVVPANELADAYEAAVIDSDGVADRLRREASRVSEKAELESQLEMVKRQLAVIEQRKETARQETSALEAGWAQVWSGTGVAPRTPSEMATWLRQRDQLLALLRDLRQRQLAIENSRRTISSLQSAVGSSLEKVTGTPPAADASLTSLCPFARKVIAEQTQLRQKRTTLERDLSRTGQNIAEATDRLASATTAKEKWRQSWSAAIGKLPIPPDASLEQAQSALKLISALMAKATEARELSERIVKIGRDEAEFAAQVANLTGAVHADVPTDDPFDTVNRLKETLDNERKRSDRRTLFIAQLEEKRTKLEAISRALSDCERTLGELCREAAGCALEDLPALIDRASERTKIQAEIKSQEDTLLGFAASGALNDLLREAEAADPDGLARRIRELCDSAGRLQIEKASFDQTCGELRQELRQKENEESVQKASEEAQYSTARIENLSAEYIRLKLAARVLAIAAERYREKNQGPILGRAGKLFAQMTNGSFEGLRVDWSDSGKPVLKGVRCGSGKLVSIEGMSEATRDQLFFALRLAFVENHCETHGPAPFIADDVLMTFDDIRATAALRALETLSNRTQVFLFTHHRHHLELADACLPRSGFVIHRLAGTEGLAAAV